MVHTKLAETTLKHGAESRRADQAETRLLAETAKLEDAEQRAAEAIVLAAELEQEINDLKARADRLGDQRFDAAAPARLTLAGFTRYQVKLAHTTRNNAR